MDVALPPDVEAEDLIEYMPSPDHNKLCPLAVTVAADDYDGEETTYAMGLCGGFLPGSSDSDSDDNFGLYYTSWGLSAFNAPRCS